MATPLLLLLALSCRGDPDPEVPPGCGDAVLDEDEECDEGEENADGTPDACREDCLLPGCGDGVVDAGEQCDDGGTWGGDGCDADCLSEEGALEVEPNDEPATASPSGEHVHGGLPAGDVDCWAVPIAGCDALTVQEEGACSGALLLAVHDPDGGLVASGSPGQDGCAIVDPGDHPGARWMADGDWAVCASGLLGAEVPSYALALSAAPTGSLDLPDFLPSDLDADDLPDSCDADRDGDGVDDVDDTCPDVSNGPLTDTPALSDDGFVRHWLGIGPFTGTESASSCRPSDDVLIGEDAIVAPSIGDEAGGATWTAQLLASDHFDLLPSFGYVSAPREAYGLVYLRSDSARALTLAVGADDGVFAWWNGTRVLDVSGCQGATADQFQAEVDVEAGWNTLLLKVRDQGGGWGLYVRLLEDDVPVVDLEPSLSPDGSWVADQSDRDGDGDGDVCDEEP